MTPTTPSAAELHLVYVLLDSNLPTGGFVSSSGLESYAKHGFLTAMPAYEPSETERPAKVPATEAIMDFSLAELDNYASTTLCFVADAWSAVRHALSSTEQGDAAITQAVASVVATDEVHESTLLSHVARRSSKAQGVAMLTLYSRGLSQPIGVGNLQAGDASEAERVIADGIVDRMKRLVRGGKVPGHLATCWGVITAALGLPLDRALHLHLFLHARSLLSSAVRLNLIGPYASSQLLLHPMRTLIEKTVERHGQAERTSHIPQDELWSWAEDDTGPATTWPLGEVLTGRHDLQHSRIFNS